jgi:hypothetical protein
MEQWKVITEHPYFEVSNYGKIRKIKTGYILKISKGSKGYKLFSTKHNGIKYTSSVHRLVAKYFINNPNPIEYDCINHIDCDRANNHYTNLEWCNKQMNTDHAVNLGRIPRKPVINTKTGEVLRSAYELSKHLGWTKSKVKHMMLGNVINKTDWVYLEPKGVSNP